MNLKKIDFFVLEIFLFLNIIKSKGILDYSHDLDSEIQIQVGALSSMNGIIPFSYEKLKICEIKKVSKAEDTLGEILTGEKIFNTGYIAKIGTNKICDTLCYNQFNQESIHLIESLIKKNYYINWYLDKLPAGLISYDSTTNNTFIDYFKGIPLGFIANEKAYIYNHLQFHILINKVERKKYNIVGFQILPMSIKHDGEKANCTKEANIVLEYRNTEKQELTEDKILFTYDIVFEKSDISFGLRWDHYKTLDTKIHWIGIIFSHLTILVLTLVIIIVLVKNIKTQINKYNTQIAKFENINYYTWKELSGDVFRAPIRGPMLLSSIIGSGFQLFLMLTITLFLGTVGFMNPEKRGNLYNIGIFLYCIMGIPGGFISSKLFKFFKGKKWILNSMLTSIIIPGTLLTGYFFVNIILIIEKSSAAVGVWDIISFFILWFLCTFPLILIGSFFGYNKKPIKAPCKTNIIPSFIPKKPCYLHYIFMTFVTGLLAFGTFFVELNYVMGSLWKHQIYFLATFLWISFFLFVIICGEISIIIIFWNLCYGDHNWWWKSFLIGASPVIYFIGFSIYYFFHLHLTGVSAIVVYFGMMCLISAISLFICGSISVLITFTFVKYIYSKIKID